MDPAHRQLLKEAHDHIVGQQHKIDEQQRVIDELDLIINELQRYNLKLELGNSWLLAVVEELDPNNEAARLVRQAQNFRDLPLPRVARPTLIISNDTVMS